MSAQFSPVPALPLDRSPPPRRSKAPTGAPNRGLEGHVVFGGGRAELAAGRIDEEPDVDGREAAYAAATQREQELRVAVDENQGQWGCWSWSAGK